MTLVAKGKIIEGMDGNQFLEFCLENPDFRIERNSRGQILFMEPTYSYTGILNSKLIFSFSLWNEQLKLGYVLDSSTGYTLPNRAIRSPDVSWIEKSRWMNLTEKEKKSFAPICPDFVLELLSMNDKIHEIRDKMKEWMENGCKLGWLIHPENQITYVYENGKTQEILFKHTLYGGNILPGFELNLSKLFSESF